MCRSDLETIFTRGVVLVLAILLMAAALQTVQLEKLYGRTCALREQAEQAGAEWEALRPPQSI